MSDYVDLYNHICETEGCGRKYKTLPSDEHSSHCPNCRGIRKELWMESIQTALEKQSKTMTQILNLMKKEISR